MLIDHKVIEVSDAEGNAELIQDLNSGYEIINSVALNDGAVRYVMRKMAKNGAYVQEPEAPGPPVFPPDRIR